MNQRFSLRPFSASDPVLAALWRQEAEAAPVFLSWDWQSAMQRLGQGAGQTLVLMRGEAPLAVLSCRTVRRHGLLRVRQWHLNETGDPAIDRVAVEYNGLLDDRDQKAAFRWLVGNLPRADEVVARNLTAAAADALAAAVSEAGWRARLMKETAAPWIDLDALRAGGRTFEETLGKNTRAALRRSKRLFEERFGALRLSLAATPSEAGAYLERLEWLHTAQWQAKGGEGAFGGSAFRRFHAAFLETALAQGRADLLRVTAGREEVGYLYNLRSAGGWIMAYQSGFAAADNRWKPGYLCHALAAAHYADQGAVRYDFLAGSSRYKRQLAGVSSPMRSVVAFAPRPLLMLENCLRRMVQRPYVKKFQCMRAIRQWRMR